MTLQSDITKQSNAISALLTKKDRFIKIYDHLSALEFKNYAESEEWSENGAEFDIEFHHPEKVKVTDQDFIKYHLHYSDFALALEEKYADKIDDLREEQEDLLRDLLIMRDSEAEAINA